MMSTPDIPLEAEGLGTPLRIYCLTNKQLQKDLAYLLVLGGAFLTSGSYLFTHQSGSHPIVYIAVGLWAFAGGVLNTIWALICGEKPRLRTTDWSSRIKGAAVVGPYLTLGGLLLVPGAISNGIGFIFAGMMLASIYLYGTVRLRLNRQDRVMMFAKGFSYTKRDKTEVVRWANVDKVWIPSADHSTKLTIQQRNGEVIVIDDQGLGNTEFIPYIEESTRQTLLPELIKYYERGQEVFFGSISVSKYGLGAERIAIPWGQIKTVGFNHKEQMQIEHECNDGKTRWTRISVADIPNRHLLKALIKHIQKLPHG